MTQIFSIKSAAMLCVATLVMCFASQDANAQCAYGARGIGFAPGFGGTGISIGYTSGYRGFHPGYGGFGRGVSVNVYRPPYFSPYVRTSTFYRGGFGVPYGGFGYGPVRHPHFHRHGHGHWHR